MHIWTGYRWAALIYKCEPITTVIAVRDDMLKHYPDAYWSNAHQSFVRKVEYVAPMLAHSGEIIPLKIYADIRLWERERFM